MADDPCRDCREYVDRLLEERHRADEIRDRWLADKFRDLERADDKTDRQVTDKFHQVNEMREQLDRNEGKFALKENLDRVERIVGTSATRDYVDEGDRATGRRVSLLEETVNNWQGRLVMLGVAWSLVILGVSWALQHVKP